MNKIATSEMPGIRLEVQVKGLIYLWVVANTNPPTFIYVYGEAGYVLWTYLIWLQRTSPPLLRALPPHHSV